LSYRVHKQTEKRRSKQYPLPSVIAIDIKFSCPNM